MRQPYREFRQQYKFEDDLPYPALLQIDKYVETMLVDRSGEEWKSLSSLWDYLLTLLPQRYLLGAIWLICTERNARLKGGTPSRRRKDRNRSIRYHQEKFLEALRFVSYEMLRMNPTDSPLELKNHMLLADLIHWFARGLHYKTSQGKAMWENDPQTKHRDGIMSLFGWREENLIDGPKPKRKKGGTERRIQRLEKLERAQKRYFQRRAEERPKFPRLTREPKLSFLITLAVLLRERCGRLPNDELLKIAKFLLFWKFEKTRKLDDRNEDVAERLRYKVKRYLDSASLVQFYDASEGVFRMVP